MAKITLEELMSSFTVKVTLPKELVFRIKIVLRLIYLACWITGTKYEIVSIDDMRPEYRDKDEG